MDEIFLTPERLAAHCRCSVKTIYRDARSTLKAKRFRGVKGLRISLSAANRYISLKHPGMTLLSPDTATREPQWCRSLHHDHAHLVDAYGKALCSAAMPLGGVWSPVQFGDLGRKCGRCATELKRREEEE